MGAPVVPSLIFPINDWSKNRDYVLRPTIGNKCEINVQGHYLVMNFVIGWHVLSLMFFWRGGESESTLGVVLVRAVKGRCGTGNMPVTTMAGPVESVRVRMARVGGRTLGRGARG